MKNHELVTQWAVNTVKEQYADDIALIVSHTTLRIDEEKGTISFFVPITERGASFGRTFILDGEGFDIWGISWDRLEAFATLAEYNITCLADGEVLYARTPEDAQRFADLQKRLARNLADNGKMRCCALKAYAEAKNIYLEMLFADKSGIRLGAGYVLDYLAQAIAFANHRYFKKSQTDQLAEIAGMAHVPEGFAERYLCVITEKSDANRKRLCYELISIVRDFLTEGARHKVVETVPDHEYDFQALADWYAEMSYTWRRIYVYAARRDIIKVYMWGIMLQDELNHVCADFNLPQMDLMTAYDADALETFVSRADALEREMRRIIECGGGKVREYASAGEFLHEV